MTYELTAIRQRFPSLAIRDDGARRIYFDNPAGTQVSEQVIDAMRDCLVEANANLHGAFETSRRADAVLAEAHLAMADFLNAQSPEEIVFGQNMTSLTLHVSRSLGRTFKAGDEIVLSRMDHDANVAPWLLLADDLDLTVRWFEFDKDSYEFRLNDLAALLNERTRLVCVGGASNLLGTINDVQAIAALARDAGALSYIDAVQLAPHVAIDVQSVGCDFLACSAYKFFGPHQGILYGRREVLESLTPYKVRPAPNELPGAFETGTQSHEGMAGTTAAVDYFAWIGKALASDEHAAETDSRRRSRRSIYVSQAMRYLFDYERRLVTQLIDGLSSVSGVRILGITDKAAFDRRVPTVAFTLNGHEPDAIARALGEQNIFVWSGHNYAVEVARSLGIYESGGAVRVGPVHYNSESEIDEFIAAIDGIARVA